MDEGAFDASMERLSEALAIAQDDPELLKLRQELETRRQQARETWVTEQLERARRAQEGGDDLQSLALIDDALAKAPGHPRLQSFRNTLLATMNRQRVEQLLARARQSLSDDDLDQALRLTDDALRLAPGDPPLVQMRTTIENRFKQRGQTERAIAEAREFQRARAFDQSLARIDDGLRVAPDNAELLQLRAAVENERQQQRQRDAAKLLEQARSQQAEGRLKQAITLAEQALLLSPDDRLIDNYRVELKSALDRQGELERIATECESMLGTQTPDLDRLTQATACFNRALAVDAHDRRARDGLARIGNAYALLAKEALADNDTKAADQALAALRELQPDDPKLADLDKDRDLLRRRLLPAMVAIKGGCFSMGSPAGRDRPRTRRDSTRRVRGRLPDWQV